MTLQARRDRSVLLHLSAGTLSLPSPSEAPAAGAQDFRFGEFRVAARVDLLFRCDEVVPLEPRAVQVLRTLAAARGQVVSKDALLDRVWPGTFVTEGVLKKAISQIRRALGSDGQGRDWIETFHRRGYRLRTADPARPASAQTLLGWRPGCTSWSRTSA